MAVTLKRIVQAPKTEIRIAPWRSGKVPKADFPMAKQAYSLGASYRWCVISFAALGLECRVLVICNFQKEKYEAILGAMRDNSLRILCSYEYHASEPGWHCHAACEEISRVPVGYMRGPWVRRIPKAQRPHSRLDFVIVDEISAQRFAYGCYGIEAEGTLL